MSSRESLMFRYARGDLSRNKGVNIALAVMLVLSAFLMATGAMVIERLVGSIDQLFEEAKPPHFLQMHSGEYDHDALEAFAESQPGIEAWTVVDLLGFDGSEISWSRPSDGVAGDFSESLVDNLFVSQNPDFDFLLDENGQIAQPAYGEVYVPVAYQQRFEFEAGDILGVRTDIGLVNLTVTGFVRDAQMASALSSATRFLVSADQAAELGAAGGADREIIVEYRLTDPTVTGALQSAYNAGDALPRNGQAVTFEMIRIINTFSDGLVAVALVFASFLLIVIAILNLRFVIRGTLQDEVREIGAMKAIGVPDRQIRRLYLSKYQVMTLIACVIGGLVAIGATAALTRGVTASYSSAPSNIWTVLTPILALALVYAFVVGICSQVLRRVRLIEVVNALVHGSTLSEAQMASAARRTAKRAHRSRLSSYRGRSMNLHLASLDLRAEARQWVLLPVVFMLASILMSIPANLLSTFESPTFVTYMGAPESDLRADIQFSDDVDAQRASLLNALESDSRVARVRAYANVLAVIDGEEGAESFRIEVGNYSGETVDYVAGGSPAAGEIAISVLNADKLALSPGDTLNVALDGQPQTLTVSGIYQDVTSGGFTAKMQGEITSGASSYVLYVDTVDGDDPATIAADYRERFPASSVIPMRDFVSQTLSYVTDSFRTAAVITCVFGVAVALLITALFLKLQLSRDRRKMGVLSAIGFSGREIAGQIRGKTLAMAILGTALGLLFSATLGGPMVGGLISLAGLGVAKLSLIPNVWLAYGVYPLLLIGAGVLGAKLLTASLRRTDKSTWLT